MPSNVLNQNMAICTLLLKRQYHSLIVLKVIVPWLTNQMLPLTSGCYFHNWWLIVPRLQIRHYRYSSDRIDSCCSLPCRWSMWGRPSLSLVKSWNAWQRSAQSRHDNHKLARLAAVSGVVTTAKMCNFEHWNNNMIERWVKFKRGKG